jgi:hypothetical protein
VTSCSTPPPISCNAGTLTNTGCRTATITGATVTNGAGSALSWAWSSSNPSVTVAPPAGNLPAGPTGAQPLPPFNVTLNGAPCNQSAVLTLTVTNAQSQTSQCTVSVTFNDTAPPVFTPPLPGPLTIACSTALPPPPPVAASDVCDTSVAVTLVTGPLVGSECNGTITRTWTAVDDCGNTATAQQVITVIDDVPPTVSVASTSFGCLWPPNHKYVCFSLADLDPVLADNCTGPVTFRVAGCSSDQCDEAPCAAHPGENGDGNTTDDCVVAPDGASFCARAERAGSGPDAQAGRHYTVTVVATDDCGNESAPIPAGAVYVPHDQSPHEDCISAK